MQSVTGSRTGRHGGSLAAYSEGDGASFLPSKPFQEGERVTVHARAKIAGAWRPIEDVFVIAETDAISSTPETIHSGSAAEEQHFHSRPDLRPPVVTVTQSSPATAPGDIFLAPYTGPGQAGPMILEAGGGLVWFKPLPRDVFATNLRVREYAGQPVLSWWQGDISVHGFGIGEDVIFGSGYTELARVRGGNGHRPDLHDFQLTPQGTALVTSYFPVLCNLSAYGGPSHAGLTDGVMQEIDVRTGLVMLEWTSLDHVPIGDSYSVMPHYETTAYPYDFFHINSINLDRDGSLLISARNTWTIYDVQPATGQIQWQLGGKHSSFEEARSVRTAWQHDARELADGAISIFDNGSSPREHPQSRAIVLSLNPQNGSATLVSQLVHDPGLTAESQGNAQALPNGDWFVGWGQEPYFSEFSAGGEQLFNAHLPPHTQSYRSFKLPWSGAPTHAPALAFVAGHPAGTVYASWNGATGVAAWRLLAGASPSGTALKPILTVPRSGFETALGVPAGTVGPYLAVQALDASGHVLATSAGVDAGLR